MMPKGFLGVRLLTAAIANVHLRRMKASPRSYHKRGFKPPAKAHSTRSRLWADGEEDEVFLLRKRGMSKSQVAKAMGRSIHSIDVKCGHVPKWGVKHAHKTSVPCTKRARVWDGRRPEWTGSLR